MTADLTARVPVPKAALATTLAPARDAAYVILFRPQRELVVGLRTKRYKLTRTLCLEVAAVSYNLDAYDRSLLIT